MHVDMQLAIVDEFDMTSYTFPYNVYIILNFVHYM